MRVAMGADHGGYSLKEELKGYIESLGHEAVDVGAHELDPADDFPDFTKAVAESVTSGKARRGIMICGSGVGASVAANKVRGVRASVCHDTYSARQGVEHDDMNVLCMGARIVGGELARELAGAFLGAEFAPEESRSKMLIGDSISKPPFRVRPNNSGLVEGIDPVRLNQLLDDLDAEEFLAKRAQ